MSWQKEVDELRRRQALAREMGGPEKLARQRSHGKLNVRERIAQLADGGSFREIGSLAGKAKYSEAGELESFQPSNLLVGRARIEGRPVVFSADDFTVRGGAADGAVWDKLAYAEQMANELRLPLIRIVDGTGGGGSVKQLDVPDGRTYIPAVPGFHFAIDNLSKVPVVGLALGPTAGLGAGRVVLSHYSMMVRGMSQLFVAGPPVVAALGEKIDKEGLGGSHMHGTNGVVDDVVESEDEAFARTRRFLSYLPQSVHELPQRGPITDDPARADEALIAAIPRDSRRAYKVRPILESVLDRGSLFEIGSGWGRSVVTGLARLDGWPVAVLANDPVHLGGGWSADASQKLVRLLDLAETFRLPLVHFVDNPGFVVGERAERASTLRHGARALAAIYQAKLPVCSIIMRRCYGLAGAAHMDQSRLRYRYAWPSGDWGSLPIEGGLEAAYKSELLEAADPAAKLAEIRERLDKVRSPLRTAESFLVEEIIDPRETRPLLCEFVNLAAPLRPSEPSTLRYRP
ncbi:MAG: putative biotin dependent acyl-CoA carboxylase [Myxococcaceae bacterium]|nr:putative biotin dependent acyl-CoA carboxylase [Myxococcaceae bacterium]